MPPKNGQKRLQLVFVDVGAVLHSDPDVGGVGSRRVGEDARGGLRSELKPQTCTESPIPRGSNVVPF